jgi:hypothetical protein
MKMRDSSSAATGAARAAGVAAIEARLAKVSRELQSSATRNWSFWGLPSW